MWDVYNYNTRHKEYNFLQASTYDQIQQQQKNIEQSRRISQTLNKQRNNSNNNNSGRTKILRSFSSGSVLHFKYRYGD